MPLIALKENDKNKRNVHFSSESLILLFDFRKSVIDINQSLKRMEKKKLDTNYRDLNVQKKKRATNERNTEIRTILNMKMSLTFLLLLLFLLLLKMQIHSQCPVELTHTFYADTSSNTLNNKDESL